MATNLCPVAIRWWLVQHPLFVSLPDEEHRNTVLDADPFVSLEQLTEAAFKTRPKARQARLQEWFGCHCQAVLWDFGPCCSMLLSPSR